MDTFISFLLALALLAASNSKIGGAASAADTVVDLQQKQLPMADCLRLYSSHKWQKDMSKLIRHLSNTVSAETADSVIQPLGAIFKAIRGMPENSATDVRSKEEAFDAAKELMGQHFRELLVPHGPGDEDLPQRRQAMAEVVGLASADAEMPPRLRLFVTREMGPLWDILFAIRNMLENSADDVRIKNGAFDAAQELMERKLRLLLPYHGPFPCFAVGKMPETTAAEVRSKEQARAVAKEMTKRYLDQLMIVPVKIDDEL